MYTEKPEMQGWKSVVGILRFGFVRACVRVCMFHLQVCILHRLSYQFIVDANLAADKLKPLNI
jgi:hypothetical protein